MWSIVEYFKRPELVVAVQECFGVEYTNESNNQVDTNDDPVYEQQQLISEFYHQNGTESQYFGDKNSVNRKNNKCHVGNEQSKTSAALLPNKVTTENGQLRHKQADHNDSKKLNYRITNKFWFYLFTVGTELGDELFYATMIPFWFWNIDGAVGRRVIFVWSAVMYIGQGLKDVIRWPRPGYPVQRLQSKWSIEYGMPSTHAMV